MNDFFPILMFLLIIISLSSKSSKKKTAKAQPRQTVVPPTPPVQPVVIQTKKATKPTVKKPAAAKARVPAGSAEQAYGSIAYQSQEGMEDPDHDHGGSLTNDLHPIFADSPEATGFSLDLSSNSLVNAMIMQEVLSKPVSLRK